MIFTYISYIWSCSIKIKPAWEQKLFTVLEESHNPSTQIFLEVVYTINKWVLSIQRPCSSYLNIQIISVQAITHLATVVRVSKSSVFIDSLTSIHPIYWKYIGHYFDSAHLLRLKPKVLQTSNFPIMTIENKQIYLIKDYFNECS